MECALCQGYGQKHRLVFEDAHSFCMICKWPLKPGHVLVLPKRHVEKLDELRPEEAQSLLKGVARAHALLKEAYGEDTLCVQNTGVHSTQKHIHLHVIPSKGGLRPLIARFENVAEIPEVPEDEMAAMCNHVKKFL